MHFYLNSTQKQTLTHTYFLTVWNGFCMENLYPAFDTRRMFENWHQVCSNINGTVDVYHL